MAWFRLDGYHTARKNANDMQTKTSASRFRLIRLFFVLLLPTAHLYAQVTAGKNLDWPVYGGAAEGGHYSPLAQINKSNVTKLQVAWTFDTGETGGLQTSPIEVNGVLYGISPTQKIFAVDAATGKLKWKFDSGIVGSQPDRGWPTGLATQKAARREVWKTGASSSGDESSLCVGRRHRRAGHDIRRSRKN